MNPAIKFDGLKSVTINGLKSVTINGKEFEIASVDIQGSEAGATTIAVKLVAPVRHVTLCMIFQKEKK